MPSSKPKYSFDPNASYIIAGGLGGLGRSIARWMAERNARHLILLSRSGAKSEDAIDLIRDLGLIGVKVAAPACDVSDESAVSSMIAECKTSMPSIRGCIQPSMVLKVRKSPNLSVSIGR